MLDIIIFIFVVVSLLVLAGIVFLKNPRNKANRYFASFLFWSVIWIVSNFLEAEPFSQTTLSLLLKVDFASAAMLGYFLMLFFLNFPEPTTGKIKERLLFIPTVLFAILSFSNLIIRDIGPHISGLQLEFKDGPLFLLYAIYLFSYVAIGCISLIIKRKKASGVKRNQISYVLMGAFLSFLFCFIINLILSQLITLTAAVSRIGIYGIFFLVGFTTYAIVRHHLMDIEVVIKKSLVFAGMFAFVFGIVVAVAMLVAQFLGAANNILSLIISALIITFTLQPIESWLINATDKFLFQKKYEYKQILKTFIDKVITVLNLDEIINSTLKLLDQTLHPYTASIVILNKAEDKYQLYNSYGLEDKNISFTTESKLIVFLKKTDMPAVIKQTDGIAGVNPEIASEMSRLKAIVVLPLMLHDDLTGFISLGKKKSDEEYTKDDLDVLQDLARTESVAVGNAQLLTEAAQSERRAAIGTMAAGIHHEIGNPLNIINTKIQLFLTGVKRGFYKSKSKDKIIEECRNILGETINQTNRIADITRRLSNFAKPSKEFKPESVNISDEIDETLAVVEHDLELEKIKINKEIPPDALEILADKHEIQQIFFNIIRNAAQAIEEEGAITIKVLSAQDNKIRIEIEDTGKGIAEDKQHRIFEPFFTTKGPAKGTGLGLSIVRQLVWRNKGEISFRSQEGVGTTFILEFPRGS